MLIYKSVIYNEIGENRWKQIDKIKIFTSYNMAEIYLLSLIKIINDNRLLYETYDSDYNSKIANIDYYNIYIDILKLDEKNKEFIIINTISI